MAQHGIEMILMRRLAAQLTMPVVLVDPRGNLVFFNEAAAPVFGRRFNETGPIARGEWSALFRPANPPAGTYHNHDTRTSRCSTKIEMSGFSKVEMSAFSSSAGYPRGHGDSEHELRGAGSRARDRAGDREAADAA